MMRMLVDLWDQHNRLDLEAGRLRHAGKPVEGGRKAIAAERVLARIFALQDLARASAPVTPADAVAQLVLIHADVSTRCDSHEDPEVAPVPAILEGAVYALVVLAKAAGFDIAASGSAYFRPSEVMIARGEVSA